MTTHSIPYKHHPIALTKDELTPPSLANVLQDPSIVAITSAFSVDVYDGIHITWDGAPNVRTTNGTTTTVRTSFHAVAAVPNRALIPALLEHQYLLAGKRTFTNALSSAWLAWGPEPDDTPYHKCLVAWTRWGVGLYSPTFLDWATNRDPGDHDGTCNGWPTGGILLTPATTSAHSAIAARKEAQQLEDNWITVITSLARHRVFTR